MQLVCCIAILFVGISSFRVKPKRKSVRKSEPGQVHGLFPMGSPGPSDPPFENARGGPCFPGYRSWTMKRQWWGVEADLATTILGPFGFRHPHLSAHELDMKKNELRVIPCSDDTETPNLPRGTPFIMHRAEFYINSSEGFSDLLYNVSNVGIYNCGTQDRAEVEQNVAAYGWQLIGSAVDEGGALYVGSQVSHLMQLPETKECILTFEGSGDFQDWVSNADLVKTSFCGLAGKVHRGFRATFRQMVQNSDWQADVRPRLSTCSKLYVTGHSLGGVLAELFTACAQKAPQQGEDGYDEDYKFIEWWI